MPFNIGDRVVHRSDRRPRNMVVSGRSFIEHPPLNRHNEYANLGSAPDGGYNCTWISGTKKGEGYFTEAELELQLP